MSARERLLTVYGEGGREAVERDPELRALLAADVELQRALELADDVEAQLSALPRIDLPEALAARIVRRTSRRPVARLVLPLVAASLVAAALVTWLRPTVVPPARDSRSVRFDLRASLQTVAEPPVGGKSGPSYTTVREAPRSTLPLGLGSAGFELVRHALAAGHLPRPEDVRVAEMINGLAYDAAPTDEALAMSIDSAPCPWSPGHRLVRVGLRAREPSGAQRLVIVVDVPPALVDPGPLSVTRVALGELASRLGAADAVAVVGPEDVTMTSMVSGRERGVLAAAARRLAGGEADMARLGQAYRLAREGGGAARVVLVTAGGARWSEEAAAALGLAQLHRELGVTLDIVEVGHDTHALRAIAAAGGGRHLSASAPGELASVLAPAAPIAKGVVAEIAFDPARVTAYRLVGVDGMPPGEDLARDLHAGHALAVLYEVVPVGVRSPEPGHDPFGYREHATARPGPLASVTLRYLDAASGRVRTTTVHGRDGARSIEAASRELRLAAAAALFGLGLREGERPRRHERLSAALALARLGEGPEPQGAELARVVELALKLSGG